MLLSGIHLSGSSVSSKLPSSQSNMHCSEYRICGVWRVSCVMACVMCACHWCMLCVINTHDTHVLSYIACLVAEELNVLGDSQERTVAGTQQRVVPIHVSHVPWWPAALVGIESSANPDLRWKRLIFG